MGRKKELAKNTAILTVGKVCTQCISFLLLPLYTAILSTKDYGSFDLLITYATLMLPLVNWQMDQGLFRFMLDCRGNFKEQSKLFSSVLAFSSIQNVIFLVLLEIISNLVILENQYFLMIYVVLHVYSAILLQFVRGLGKNVIYAVASFISATSTTITNVLVLVVFKMGLKGLFLATIVSQIITIAYLLLSTRCWIYFSIKNIKVSTFKNVKRYSVPLIPNNLAWWVVNVSDRTIVARFLGVAINGIYSVANKFSNVFIQFYNILNLSWTETVSLHYKDEDRDVFLSDTITYLFRIVSCVCFVIVGVMPFVYPILVDAKYSDGYFHVLILMYAMLFRVMVGLYSCIYVAQKNAKKIAYTSMTAAIINISVHLLLIEKIHLFAASFSTLVAFLVMFVVRYIDINREIRVHIRSDVAIKSLILGTIIIFSYYSGNRVVQIVTLMMTCIYSIYSNVDILKSCIKIARNRMKVIIGMCGEYYE